MEKRTKKPPRADCTTPLRFFRKLRGNEWKLEGKEKKHVKSLPASPTIPFSSYSIYFCHVLCYVAIHGFA